MIKDVSTNRLNLAWFATQPWALDQRYLSALMSANLQFETPQRTEKPQPKQSQVAVLNIHGPIVARSSYFSRLFGAVALDELSETLKGLAADPATTAVVLSIDSPGGSVAGLPEFAALVREMKAVKPIIAVADTMACSAAYWIGSQATEFVASPSAEVGSIGVYSVHYSYAGLLEKEGIKPTLVKTPENKAEGHPDFPLEEEAKAEMKRRIDEIYNSFVSDVAKGRGVDEQVVRDTYGKGRSLSANDALQVGMVDRVATLDATVQGLVVAPSKGASTSVFAEEAGKQDVVCGLPSVLDMLTAGLE